MERRKLIMPLLLPGRVKELEAPLRDIADQQVALMRERGELDIVTEYAAKIAIGGLCLSAGFPIEDAELLREWVNTISERNPDTLGLSDAGVEAYAELADYATDLIRRQRGNPENSGGVIARLASAEVEGGRSLNEDELVGHVREFLIGGAETFQKSFAACVHRLWEHPDQRREAAKDPGLLPNTFLEALRLDTPGQFMGRTTLRDTEIAGVPVYKGQVVLLIWPSGNRDPREFTDPDRFDIHRRASRMLAFGAGVHDCLGRHLAVTEGAVALAALLAAAPEYELDLSRSSRLVSEFVQGFTTLPIRCA
jgi:cytochrome P450